MEEIKSMRDRCTVLRDDKYIDTVRIRDTTRNDLADDRRTNR